MTRAIQKAASNSLNTTNALGSGYASNAKNIYSSLEPQLQQEATNPQGYSPTDLASARTGARQASGGSTSGITGQANLNVARTRNPAGYNAVLDKAAQDADQTNSQAELGIEGANANLKQQQQQSALSSLGSLYGQNVGAGESYYGMAPSTLNAWSTGGNQGWLQNTEGILNSIGNLAGGVGGAATGIRS